MLQIPRKNKLEMLGLSLLLVVSNRLLWVGFTTDIGCSFNKTFNEDLTSLTSQFEI